MFTALLLATAVTAICSLAALTLLLRFLWSVYCRGGSADMRAAAESVRLIRPPLGMTGSSRHELKSAMLHSHPEHATDGSDHDA